MYFGMALGAALGGVLLPTVGVERLAWVGAPLALSALGLLLWSAPSNAVPRVAA
jgi:predicted MFS family arabinose efflux permease